MIMTNRAIVRHAFMLCALPLLAAVSACSLQEQTAPSVVGPAEFGLSVSGLANPDTLRRDGTSQSQVTVRVLNSSGTPVPGQRVTVSLLTAPSGTVLSASDVTTGSDGRVTFVVTAPPSTVPGDAIVVGLTPVGDNFANAVPRTVSIAVTPSNQSAPVPAFTFQPEEPTLADTIVFNAATTTDEGVECGSRCTYAWDFGDGTTATGVTASKQYTTSGAKVVRLTVTDNAGASASTTRTVIVAGPTVPVAGTIVFGPTPVRVGAVTQFDAGSATVGQGASIVDYTWVWGDGDPNTVTTGPQATHTFAAVGTFTVRVTVRDNLGRTASSTATVAVTAAP